MLKTPLHNDFNTFWGFAFDLVLITWVQLEMTKAKTHRMKICQILVVGLI